MTTQTTAPQPAAGSTAPRRRGEAPWRTVMVREMMVKLTDKSYVIGTLVTLLLVIGSAGISALMANRGDHTDLVATSPQAQSFADGLATAVHAADDKDEVSVHRAADVAAAEQMLRAGDADALLEQVDGRWRLVFKDSVDDGLVASVNAVLNQQVLEQAAKSGGTSVAELNQASTVQTRQLDGDSQRGGLGKVIGLVFAVLFFMSALTFGMQIAQSVIEEKQSRIVEILVAAIPVRQLLAGKVLGNTVLALAQMALMVGAGLVGASFVPQLKAFLPELVQASGWYLLLFLASFMALACVWAAAGAMATRNEDLQQTSSPLIYLLMIAYGAGFMASGVWKVVLSYVPIISGILMPTRIIEGTAHWWDGVIALLVNIAFAAVTVLLGERIYRRALLRTQGRLSYREALKLKA
ncbi:ABC transporter permease [Luteococcus peritonei]|uniref:ABC transporter permease n=1 Tax=Luteococcus peritonei TaxID=88874 RepID=A0ABW4RY46_9ACTN